MAKKEKPVQVADEIILQPVLGYTRNYYGNHIEFPHGKVKRRSRMKGVWRKKIKVDKNDLELYNTSWNYIVFNSYKYNPNK